MNVLVDLIDNLETTLSKLGEAILDMFYKHLDTTMLMSYTDENGQEFAYSVIGNGMQIQGSEGFQALSLPERAKVKVKIVSGTGFTKQSRQELLMQLRAGGDVDRKTMLQELGLDHNMIQERLTEEQMPPMPPQPPMEMAPEGMPLPPM
jgi:hypothetical protein